MLRRTLLLKVSSHGTMLWQMILGQPQIGNGNAQDQTIAVGQRELVWGVLKLHGGAPDPMDSLDRPGVQPCGAW
jgi:hypothetical protein